jgi:hypothetical protein
MPSRSQWSRVFVALAMALVPVFSHRVWADDLQRIRPESDVLKTVMATARERSVTFRSLVERIERSDLIVYMTCSHFESVTLAGRTLLAAARPGVRYVRVQILCQQPQPALVTIVAHELQHAVEIASMPEAVDDRSVRRAFSAIGFSTCQSPRSEQFETRAAWDTGKRVGWEVVHHPQPSGVVRDHAGERFERRNGD